MGYGAHAIAVIKSNRALLKKRKLKDIRELVRKECDKTEVEFKEVSPEKLAQIKTEIRRKAKEDRLKEIGLYILSTGIVLYGLYWLFFK